MDVRAEHGLLIFASAPAQDRADLFAVKPQSA